MKRSAVNEIIREGEAFIRAHGLILPPFAYWSPEEMRRRTAADSARIRDHRMGWDITDYGQGHYDSLGLFLFTVRNGTPANVPAGRGMLYAEKIMISGEDQLSPMHRHDRKTEDIINRGGGRLVLELYGATDDEEFSDEPVTVLVDAIERTVEPGGTLVLEPGESITLVPRLYHRFYGEPGKGLVLTGEVSKVNDDENDNRFKSPLGRYPQIDEDEEPIHLLVSDYERYLGV